MGNRTHKDDIDRVPTEEPAGTACDRDFCSWSLVREGRRDAVGRENVAEEVESSGRERFESAFRVPLLHVLNLKWDHQPARRSRSWIFSIEAQRRLVLDKAAFPEACRHSFDDIVSRAVSIS